MIGCSPTYFTPAEDIDRFCEETGFSNMVCEDLMGGDIAGDDDGFENGDNPRGDLRGDGRDGGNRDGRGDRGGDRDRNGYRDRRGGRDGYRTGGGERGTRDFRPRRSFKEVTYDVQMGQASILYINDISPSMSPEHKNSGKQSRQLLNDLKNIGHRVFVITMDISSSPGNPVRGASYQDGNLIKIGGRDFLENRNIGRAPSSEDVSALASALAQQETLDCDQDRKDASKRRGSAYDDCVWTYGDGSSQCDNLRDRRGSENCPSSDERGIHAANLALDKHPAIMERPDDHLIIIFHSNEDNRSSEEFIDARYRDGEDFTLETYDYPETLVDKVYQMDPGKTMSVHSIIIPPGDRKCLDRHRRNVKKSGRGYYGETYARLSQADPNRDPELTKYGNLLRGQVISICDRSYAGQFKKIAVYANVPRITLPCADPHKVEFYENGKKIKLDYKVEEGTRSLNVTDSLSISSQLRVKVTCEVTP